jgi:hypothetical protein
LHSSRRKNKILKALEEATEAPSIKKKKIGKKEGVPKKSYEVTPPLSPSLETPAEIETRISRILSPPPPPPPPLSPKFEALIVEIASKLIASSIPREPGSPESDYSLIDQQARVLRTRLVLGRINDLKYR